jgi:hypothetical protein
MDSQPLSVIELFQSQGCSSCPPTETNLHALFLQPNLKLLLLTYDVTYWDHLGWTDTFGNKLWDQRQRAYAAKWGKRSVYTPQVVVDGVADGVGSGKNEVQDIVARAKRERTQLKEKVKIVFEGSEMIISGEAVDIVIYDVLLVVFDPREQRVEVTRGENRGRTLTHWNLVKEITRIAEWTGGESRIGIPGKRNVGLGRAVILQDGFGGAILAAHMA